MSSNLKISSCEATPISFCARNIKPHNSHVKAWYNRNFYDLERTRPSAPVQRSPLGNKLNSCWNTFKYYLLGKY